MRLLKRLVCSHTGTVLYDGIRGGMGFLYREMRCKNCGKKFQSLTHETPSTDTYRKGQVLTAKDCERFNREVN